MGDFRIKALNSEVFDSISEAARRTERRRMNLDLRNSDRDQSQRMLNAIEPGTVLPVHRHKETSETCIVLRGSAVEIFYDGFGNETERILMRAGGKCCGCNIPVGAWHRIEPLERGTVIFEAKDGAYASITPDDILNV